MKNVCRKCHKQKARKILSSHQKTCIPSESDLTAYRISKGSSMTEKEKNEQKARDKE